MLRGLFWLGALVGIVYVIIAWATSGPDSGSGKVREPKDKNQQDRGNQKVDPPPPGPEDDSANPRLETSGGGRPTIVLPQKATRLAEPVIIRQARVNPFDRQEVSTQREGLLLFLGTEV